MHVTTFLFKYNILFEFVLGFLTFAKKCLFWAPINQIRIRTNNNIIVCIKKYAACFTSSNFYTIYVTCERTNHQMQTRPCKQFYQSNIFKKLEMGNIKILTVTTDTTRTYYTKPMLLYIYFTLYIDDYGRQIPFQKEGRKVQSYFVQGLVLRWRATYSSVARLRFH